ncbi:hypothetical protein CONPUDRAFT_128258 [Coniophora puteana RWD-64-598 SS2]|uniref:BUB1 N-terminal domain-containing protein n=1 Tax=Coniophora puteana (strain RWD-64-598) TaxID=741705 RepID=A0A5M3MIW4_CONPW|nr:uncharacterized protein CONPUDRAFT_128258 [Coniophora puteana RWD-64-598 SS2]EIW78585.1 hypothetical protein CONPUDRAFT_128258 [Coniophora puteana RWD-64-598 SS2]
MESADDVFSSSSEQAVDVVDGDLLEAAKENIQPLAKGRRVTTLSAILSTPHAQRDAHLLAAKRRHRINVTIALEDEDDDPLEAYCRFVDWTLENYPQGQSAESGLLELLEEATRILKDDRAGKWKSEMKYLKLWTLYASYVEKPVIIFNFLLANDIGTTHALLYEEHANALEKAGRRTDADNAYLLGIARQASPLDHLQSKHREFQKRMLSSRTAPPPESADAVPPAPARRALRSASASSSRIPSSTARPLGASSSQGDVFGAQHQQPATRPTNGRLQVFVDPTGAEAGDELGATNAYPELGTRKTRVKENVPESRKASGTTIKQPGRSKRIASDSRASSTSKIVPFRDPEPPASGASRSSNSGSKIVPFRDAEPSTDRPSKAKSSTSATKLVPFRDPEPPASGSSLKSSVSGSKIAPFRDPEQPATVPSASKSSGSKMVPFRDSAAPASGPSTSNTSKTSGSKMVPFRDPAPGGSSEGGSMLPPPALKASVLPKTPARPTIVPFRDPEPAETRTAPSTPKFTPFRDDSVVSPMSATGSAPDTIMKIKGSKGAVITTEAEALRKDPLKNYSSAEPGVEHDG